MNNPIVLPGQLTLVRDDGVRVTVTSSANPSWQGIIDRRKGGIITELCLPAAGDNLVATDGGRFEGLCNLVYVDFEETGKPEGYVAKGTYSYHGTLGNLEITEQSPERIVVTVSGKSGNQTKPRADVVAYQQQYEFLPDRIVCSGNLEWLFDQVVSGSHPELIQLNSKFSADAVTGEMRVWDRDSGPVLLPQTNSKGSNYPAGIDYPLTVEVPLKRGYAVRLHSLELPADFIASWNSYIGTSFPGRIDGQRGFASQAPGKAGPDNGSRSISAKPKSQFPIATNCQITTQLPPPSPVISKVDLGTCGVDHSREAAPGSDNWPMTWGDDGNLYTAYGDGNGFEPFVESKLSLGLARISGGPNDFKAINLRIARHRTIWTWSGRQEGQRIVDGRWRSLHVGAERRELAAGSIVFPGSRGVVDMSRLEMDHQLRLPDVLELWPKLRRCAGRIRLCLFFGFCVGLCRL